MNIKEFYLNEYPTDELGIELIGTSTFVGLLDVLHNNTKDVYDYIGVGDSLVRERVFARLAEILEMPYDYVYNLWLN
jgi:hypothetical protein